MMRQLLLWILSLVCVTGSLLAHAHDGRPLYLEIDQLDDTDYVLAWKFPPTLDRLSIPEIRLNETCESDTSLATNSGLSGSKVYHCPKGVPESIHLAFPRANPSLSSIARVKLINFEPKYIHAGPGLTMISIPSGVDTDSVFTQYSRLGIGHILGGFDHLLFLVCVVWLALTFKRIVLAVTGFTLAHSVTLALAALEVITPSIEPTEALIALSLVFVAAELVRQRKETLSWRFPVAVSSVFGLLHGLGFASVLKEIGLPTDDALLALLSFNIGVEIGQAIFIAGLVIAAWLLVKVSKGFVRLDSERPRILSGYLVGILSAFWFFQRLALF